MLTCMLLMLAVSFAGAADTENDYSKLTSSDQEILDAYKKQYIASNRDDMAPFNDNVDDTVEMSKIKFILHFGPRSNVSWNANDDSPLDNIKFHVSQKVKVYVPGWLQSGNDSHYQRIQYLERIRGNKMYLVVVNYEEYAGRPYEYVVKKASSLIGQAVAKMLRQLMNRGFDESSFRLMGLDIGAHIAGQAARLLEKKVPQITALAPSGILYKNMPEISLNKTDASFVDVIHTDKNTMGYPKSLGHADFYPSGGQKQPGCAKNTTESYLCNHLIATSYYLESADNAAAFAAKNCSSYTDFTVGNCYLRDTQYMGRHVSKQARGNYYLQVGDTRPYGLGLLSAYPSKTSS